MKNFYNLGRNSIEGCGGLPGIGEFRFDTSLSSLYQYLRYYNGLRGEWQGYDIFIIIDSLLLGREGSLYENRETLYSLNLRFTNGCLGYKCEMECGKREHLKNI